jgi:glycosyltransferase involved in cell wall biosynthesis
MCSSDLCYFKVGDKNSFFRAIECLYTNSYKEKKENLKKIVSKLNWKNYTENFYNLFLRKR